MDDPIIEDVNQVFAQALKTKYLKHLVIASGIAGKRFLFVYLGRYLVE